MEAPCKLHIIVVGCGISGLCLGYLFAKAGHRVTIVEAAATLSNIGAGVVLGPNVTKLLIRWGLREKLEAISVKTQTVSFRRYDTGERMGVVSNANMEYSYGAPQYQIHRADLYTLLAHLALSSPDVILRLGCRVTSISPYPPSPHVVTHRGETISGDMIIGADGVRSTVRATVVGALDSPVPSGDAVYRLVLDTEPFLKDPDLRPFVEESDCSIWRGPGKLVVGYCVRAKKEYSLVMSHLDTNSVESWTAIGDVEEMFKTYEGWDPRLRKIQALATSVLDFRLLVRGPLKTWIHPNGLVTLIGDACHPMLPYRAQGVSMAIEDAAVLGNLFSRVSSKSEIPVLLKAYETLRHSRATGVQLAALEAGKMMRRTEAAPQVEQQPEKAAKSDAVAKEELPRSTPPPPPSLGSTTPVAKKEGGEESPKPATHSVEEEAIFGYDADSAVEAWWKEYKS